MQEAPHGIRPPLQIRAQLPALQKELGAHAFPHRPQLDGSVSVFVQAWEQTCRGGSHEAMEASPRKIAASPTSVSL